MSCPIVELRNVVKNYAIGTINVAALGGVNLEIHPGEYAVIMGPSGSGKSTLLNLLGCLDRVSDGHYLLNGEDISRLDDDVLSDIRAKRIGFIFQSYNLIPQLTVLENIEIPLYYQDAPERETRERALAMARRMGLGDRLGHKPSQLSGGQQQRVAIARSLVSDPLLILADEPTGNLDSKTGEEILKVIDQLNDEGKTIVMVTHDEAIAARAHRVIFIMDGAIQSNTLNRERGAPRAALPEGAVQ